MNAEADRQAAVSLAAPLPRQDTKHRIAMISDFFLPNMGGVEMHIYQLSQCLIRRGNKVIVITHTYDDRQGVRYMTNGLKVYYLPQQPFYNQSSFPGGGFQWLPYLRAILVRERIDIVHTHQAFSCLAHESLWWGSVMNYKTVFTDHSLFGFADASSIHMNKLLKMSLSDCTHVICVSNTSKENTVLRASLDPLIVSTIPNAVDCTKFTPNPSARRDDGIITIVVVSRLVYRKGMDLLIDVIPEICRRFSNVEFVIGGDGPKRVELEEMREKHQLHERVEMLGSVRHSDVRDVLARGHIFLNCSLTEAFCIAIVEAASTGLIVVSTEVGGVPEVLPPDMIHFAEPSAEAVVDAVCRALPKINEVDPFEFHERVKKMYNWNEVAERTEVVYNRMRDVERLPLLSRLRRHLSTGSWVGRLFVLCIAIGFVFWRILEWIRPREAVDEAIDFPYKKYAAARRNHQLMQ
eukprot:TRINITY_DN8730_c0_g1_i1.p1 TRINITY_DN8730_c0_g1~~TRINITY_DN8730_c0_g1_i1.p1  ORF type:complete len:464 (+),score=127.64 TRINITY_DN8730_c0_g1_i1:253-1644(+)